MFFVPWQGAAGTNGCSESINLSHFAFFLTGINGLKNSLYFNSIPSSWKKHGKNVKAKIHYGMIKWYFNSKVNIESLWWKIFTFFKIILSNSQGGEAFPDFCLQWIVLVHVVPFQPALIRFRAIVAWCERWSRSNWERWKKFTYCSCSSMHTTVLPYLFPI